MKQTIRILVADDHIMVRNGIRSMLESQGHFTPIITEAENGAEVISLVCKNPFDIVLLDIQMPKIDGLSAIHKLRKLGRKVPVLVMSPSNDVELIQRVLDSDILGIILKSTGVEELTKAIETVCDMKRYYCNEVTQIVLEFNTSMRRQSKFIESLTRREKQILKMLAEEMTTDEIAVKLKISRRTVEGHRNNLKSKLQVKSTVGLVKFALENTFIYQISA